MAKSCICIAQRRPDEARARRAGTIGNTSETISSRFEFDNRCSDENVTGEETESHTAIIFALINLLHLRSQGRGIAPVVLRGSHACAHR
jgi:hypothetical protein